MELARPIHLVPSEQLPLSAGATSAAHVSLRAPQSISYIGPGRTLYETYQWLGGAAERHANRAAHQLGLGPLALMERIPKFMGDMDREAKLQQIRNNIPRKLEKDCLKLVGYALPSESAQTQTQAFKGLVMLATRFPDLRRVFMRYPRLQSLSEEAAVAAVWKRCDLLGYERDFVFHLNFAAACVAGTDIAVMIETSTLQMIWQVDVPEGLSIVERLLVASHCDGTSEFSGLISLRYLGGILECPSFWSQSGPLFDVVLKKILLRAVTLLKDLGIDHSSIIDMDALKHDGYLSTDAEGADILCEFILIGVLDEEIKGCSRANVCALCWYPVFWKLIQLSRHPQAEKILPNSWRRATSTEAESMVPTLYTSQSFENLVLAAATDSAHHSLSLSRPDEESSSGVISDSKLSTAVSKSLDKALAVEREHRKRSSNIKILLLGQEESGKSTLLKNLQLTLAPRAFQAEAKAWRPVIHLNLVQSVNLILSLLEIRHFSTLPDSDATTSPDNAPSEQLRRLSARLAPLQRVEESLSSLVTGSRSGSGWTTLGRGSTSPVDRHEEMQTRRILRDCAKDISLIWASPQVQQGLRDQHTRLQEQYGFFLDEVQRICQDTYIPTEDDILRARVRTPGLEEHVIHLESGTKKMQTWTVYSMGGLRGQRAVWAQFFDDGVPLSQTALRMLTEVAHAPTVQAIIMLAPISAFNETLTESHSVNRLADSLHLWRMICSNQLLSSVKLILFLNKVHILQRKIKSGIRFADHVTSFRNRPNESNEVIKYLKDAFRTIKETYSLHPRSFYLCVTSVIGRKSALSIREIISHRELAATSTL